jgi:hypothetical protein
MDFKKSGLQSKCMHCIWLAPLCSLSLESLPVFLGFPWPWVLRESRPVFSREVYIVDHG